MKIKFNEMNLFYFLLLFFLFKPTGLNSFSLPLNYCMNVGKELFVMLVFLFFVANIIKKGMVPELFFWLLISIFVGTILVTTINRQNLSSSISYFQGPISVVMFCEMWYFRKKKISVLLRIIRNVLSIYTVLDMFTIIKGGVFISGSYVYLLGNKNMQILYVLPLLFVISLRWTIKNKYDILDIFMIVISILTVTLTKSSTSLVALILFLFMFFSIHFRKFSFTNYIIKKLPMVFFLILFLVCEYLLLFMNIQEDFSTLINNLFDKQATFSGRTLIWSQAISMVCKNPFGYGWDAVVTNVYSTLGWGDLYVNIGHAHNIILNFAYKSGVLASFLYIVLLFTISVNLDKCNIKETVKIIFKCFFIIFLVLSAFESYPANCEGLFMILSLIYLESKYGLLNGEEYFE